jgi:APA family basic amino acid/polyamine antiporter
MADTPTPAGSQRAPAGGAAVAVAPGGGATADLPTHAGGLERVLGVPALFSTAYGNVGSSIYYALGLVASFALGLTPLAFIFAGAIFVMTACTYAEGTARYPEAGGSSSFARHAFNEFVSFTTAWAQMLNYVITMSISAFFVPHYLGVFWPALKQSPGDVYGGIIVIAILATMNIVGVKETAALNIGLALVDFGTQVALAVLGAALLLSPHTLVTNIHWGVAPTWTQFFTGITVAMIAYTGIETISNMAEETRDPVRSVPRAIMWVVVAVMALYVILPVVALSALPVYKDPHGHYFTQLGLPGNDDLSTRVHDVHGHVRPMEQISGYAGDPFVGLVHQFNPPVHWIETALLGYVGVLAAIILFIATNAGIIGVSRLTYSMGQYQQVPDVLRRIHPKYKTPYIAILIFSGIGMVVLLPPLFGWIEGSAENTLLGNLYAFGAMLSFTIAHVSVLVMRMRGGDLPFRAPINLRLGKLDLPMFAILGGIGTGAAWVVQVLLHPTERYIGLAWMVSGPLIYVVYRRARGLSLTETVRAPIVVEMPSAEVSYHNILLPVLSGSLDTRALVVACRLAADRGATLYVLAPIEVPQSLPLTAVLGDVERVANRELDRARAIAEEYGIHIVTRLERVRRAEASILQQARDRESDLIVLGVPRRRIPGMALLSRTPEKIVRRAQGRVVLVREGTPATAAAPGGRGTGPGPRGGGDEA